MRRVVYVVVGAVLCFGVAVVAVACNMTQIVLSSMRPTTPFDPALIPPPTDYADDSAWLALPSTHDEADVALPELPATMQPAADVFFLHSTSSVAPQWNARDEGEVRTASIRGGTLIQASAFNACCAVYAPGYTQATGLAFVTPSPDGQRAIDVAYADVERAFDAFEARRGSERPFVVAGHSQGSFLAARLLRDRILGTPAAERLVAAYLIGAPLSTNDISPALPCTAPQGTGCVVSFNARGASHDEHPFEFGGKRKRDAICTNVMRGVHTGAVFFDADTPALLPAFVRGDCRDGRFVVDEMGALPNRGVPSSILLQVMGGENFHSIEYQLFYADLRHDAVSRTAAYLRQQH